MANTTDTLPEVSSPYLSELTLRHKRLSDGLFALYRVSDVPMSTIDGMAAAVSIVEDQIDQERKSLIRFQTQFGPRPY